MKASFFLLFQTPLISLAQDAPCENSYGSAEAEANIITQMRFGTVTEAQEAIYTAQNSRGIALGCPEIALDYYPADYSIPLLSEVINVWNTNHQPAIESYEIGCPRIGRYENNVALGAYYAMQADYFENLSVLADIGNMMESQQYSSANVMTIDPIHEGVFGYIHVGALNPCYPGGVVGSSVNAVCDAIPSFCVPYDNGLFAGEEFLIADQSDDEELYDGGIAYDHGWIGVQMIEGALQQTNEIQKGKFKNAAVLAGKWAIAEHCVKNHNYTAKLIWLLAELYAWSGDVIYKNELNHKLEKNLLPGILMDQDENGFVDNTSPEIAFADLHPAAQTPGRMWDGHNALPWYSAMNAWALTEAYVAFRDQGESERAMELRPYMIAMLDNLSKEIIDNGIVADVLGVRDLTYALLIGIWKVARYEDEAHPQWDSAAWAMWNSGYFDAYTTNSVCVGLYLAILSDTAYEPLSERGEFGSIETITSTKRLSLYPNPAGDFVTFSFDNFTQSNVTLRLSDLKGRVIFSTETTSSSITVKLSDFAKGVYTATLLENNQQRYAEKLVIQ